MPIVKDETVINGEDVTIYIEVDNLPPTKSPYDNTRSGEAAEKVLADVGDVFGEAMKLTRNCAKRVVDSIKQMDEAIRPEEFEVKLAVKLDSQVGAVIAKASAGAQMEVTLKWKPRSQL